MTYELAKQLKDAGFPQSVKGERQVGHILEKKQDFLFQEPDVECVYAPSLSELIAACGEELVGLTKYVEGRYLGHGWAAIRQKPYYSYANYFEAETPEEAVAKLWLALNKK